MTHALTRYALAMAVTLALAGWALTLALTGADAASAIAISAMVLPSFRLARSP